MINHITLIGYVGADPVDNSKGDKKAAAFSLATTERWKDKITGIPQEKTEWHSIALFDKLAELALQYVKKGSLLYVDGKISYGKYTDGRGFERYTCQIIANRMKFLGSSDKGSPQYEAMKAENADPKLAEQELTEEDIPF